MSFRAVIAASLTLLLVSCASSGPNITVNAAPGSDLSSLKTWNFMQPLGTDRNGARTAMSTMLMSSVSREMANRGLQLSDQPDVLVDFFVTTAERLDVRTTPSSMSSRSTHQTHRSHWNRGWYSTWPSYRTTVRQYTQGTLLIDLIDPNANAMLAEGAAENRLRGDELTQLQFDEIVGQVLSKMMP
jgi:hypothetical protein